MTQDKFVQTRRKMEAYRGTPTDDNADCANLDKSNAQVINGQFLSGLKKLKYDKEHEHEQTAEQTTDC